MSPGKIGIIDGTLFFITWLTFMVLVSFPVWDGFPILFVFLVPITALVSWRGTKNSKLLIANKSSLLSFMRDGFKWGGIAGAGFMLFIIANDVRAAGSHLIGVSVFSWEFVKYIIYFALPITFVSGVLGAIHGVIFFYLNRWLVGVGSKSCS